MSVFLAFVNWGSSGTLVLILRKETSVSTSYLYLILPVSLSLSPAPPPCAPCPLSLSSLSAWLCGVWACVLRSSAVSHATPGQQSAVMCDDTGGGVS